MDFSLPKTDILRSRNDIQAILESRDISFKHPLKACFRTNTGSGRVRMMVSVPKRHFKRAVKRNYLKRLVREAFRLNRHLLGEGAEADVFFVYLGKETMDYAAIESSVRSLLEELREKLCSQAEDTGKLSSDSAGEALSGLHLPV